MNRRTNLKTFLLISVFLLAMGATATGKIIFVDANAPGPTHDGSSWTNAYKYLQDALTDANSAVKPVEIRVAEGIYTPDSNSADPNGSGDRTATFQLIDGVTINGGYAGYAEADPNAQNIDEYETILSGDLNGDDGPNFTNNAENSYHVVTGSGTDETAVLDGLTVSSGVDSGMYNEGGSPTLLNCTFSKNSALNNSGGMFNINSSSPTLTNCTFTWNWGHVGGGMGNKNSSPTLNKCKFISNTTPHFGGAMSNRNNSNPTLTNCTFSANQDYLSEGGAIYNENSSLTLTNCILWGDTPEEIYDHNSTIVITYSDVQGGWVGEGNIDVDPCFADPCNADYHLQSTAGRWNPNSQSWVLDDVTSPCIDAGNPGCPLGDEPNDPNNIRINMGAYGGTTEASKSPADWRNIADFTNDWKVDFNDLKVFVDYWLETGQCIPSDLNRSQAVDFVDVAIFCKRWSDTSAIEPGIEYQVDDCNMAAGRSSVASEPGETRFSVRVEGSYIHFEDLITANCCIDEIEMLMTVEDNLITIYEIEHLIGVPCPCICDYPTTATLGPFEEGNYLVEVIDVNGSSLGMVEVTIGEPVAPSITYQIEDCNREAAGLFAEEESPPTRFTVTVEGSYIHFEDMMPANCCPDELELQMTVEENLITIYETEYTSEGCRCMCTFPVTATLGPFEPGTYTLEVYQDGSFIGSTTVIIGPTDF